MTLETNIFTLVLCILILMVIYWWYMDKREQEEMEQRLLKKPIEKRIQNTSHVNDYGTELCIFGFVVGALSVYLWGIPWMVRATIPELIDFITNNYNKPCGEGVKITYPIDSNNRPNCYEIIPMPDTIYPTLIYMIIGAIIGAGVGWWAGKLIKKHE